VHRLENDLPPYRADLTRADRRRAVRRRGRHRGRLVRRVRPGEQRHNLRHRHHPPNPGVSMSVPHVAPRGKSRRNPTPILRLVLVARRVRTSCGAATPAVGRGHQPRHGCESRWECQMKNQVRGPGRTAGVFIVPRRANLQLAIMTGARRGALCALSWNHFDLRPGVSVGPLHPRHRDRPRRSVRLEVAPDGSPGARATLERDVEQVAMISPAAVPAPPARRGGRRGPGSGCIGTSR